MSALRQAFTELRAESGLTYDELAEISGLSRRTLLNIGAGTYRGDLRTWLILTRALGLSLDSTLSPVWGSDDPRKEPGAQDGRRGL
ncbi:helix-turn-helix transcriptional regulator [Glutamicibacter protophormiae]|nr:helix-turn-helix transcriptional regulator [Glutamicibacter protophormiae]